MICYRIVDGVAQDIRFVSPDYVAQPGEIIMEGDELPPPETLSPMASAKRKQAARDRIDAAAGRARARYITVAPGQEAVYILKAAEADRYVDAGRPADTTAYPMLSAEAEARGMTVSDFADYVRSTRDAWVEIAARIEAIRAKGNLDVLRAVSHEEIEAVANRAISALGEI